MNICYRNLCSLTNKTKTLINKNKYLRNKLSNIELLGKEFNEKFNSFGFAKYLTRDLVHYNYKYKLGLNIDTQEFNHKLCCNGLHFTDANLISNFSAYGNNIGIITSL